MHLSSSSVSCSAREHPKKVVNYFLAALAPLTTSFSFLHVGGIQSFLSSSSFPFHFRRLFTTSELSQFFYLHSSSLFITTGQSILGMPLMHLSTKTWIWHLCDKNFLFSVVQCTALYNGKQNQCSQKHPNLIDLFLAPHFFLKLHAHLLQS